MRDIAIPALKLILIPLVLLAVAGCATPQPVIRDRIVEIKVPVIEPCLAGPLPQEPVALRDRYSYDQWMAMTTSEREALSLAQGLDRKIHGDKTAVAVAGCL